VLQGAHVKFVCRWSLVAALQLKQWVADDPLHVRQLEWHCLQVCGEVEVSMNQPSVVLHGAQVLFE
jgi:hypothetical protein